MNDYVSLFMIFSCLWWIIFFISLPVGVKIPIKIEKGYASSSPEKPYIFIKIVASTLITIILTYLIHKLIKANYLTFLIEF